MIDIVSELARTRPKMAGVRAAGQRVGAISEVVEDIDNWNVGQAINLVKLTKLLEHRLPQSEWLPGLLTLRALRRPCTKFQIATQANSR